MPKLRTKTREESKSPSKTTSTSSSIKRGRGRPRKTPTVSPQKHATPKENHLSWQDALKKYIDKELRIVLTRCDHQIPSRDVDSPLTIEPPQLFFSNVPLPSPASTVASRPPLLFREVNNDFSCSVRPPPSDADPSELISSSSHSQKERRSSPRKRKLPGTRTVRINKRLHSTSDENEDEEFNLPEITVPSHSNAVNIEVNLKHSSEIQEHLNEPDQSEDGPQEQVISDSQMQLLLTQEIQPSDSDDEEPQPDQQQEVVPPPSNTPPPPAPPVVPENEFDISMFENSMDLDSGSHPHSPPPLPLSDSSDVLLPASNLEPLHPLSSDALLFPNPAPSLSLPNATESESLSNTLALMSSRSLLVPQPPQLPIIDKLPSPTPNVLVPSSSSPKNNLTTAPSAPPNIPHVSQPSNISALAQHQRISSLPPLPTTVKFTSKHPRNKLKPARTTAVPRPPPTGTQSSKVVNKKTLSQPRPVPFIQLPINHIIDAIPEVDEEEDNLNELINFMESDIPSDSDPPSTSKKSTNKKETVKKGPPILSVPSPPKFSKASSEPPISSRIVGKKPQPYPTIDMVTTVRPSTSVMTLQGQNGVGGGPQPQGNRVNIEDEETEEEVEPKFFCDFESFKETAKSVFGNPVNPALDTPETMWYCTVLWDSKILQELQRHQQMHHRLYTALTIGKLLSECMQKQGHGWPGMAQMNWMKKFIVLDIITNKFEKCGSHPCLRVQEKSTADMCTCSKTGKPVLWDLVILPECKNLVEEMVRLFSAGVKTTVILWGAQKDRYTKSLDGVEGELLLLPTRSEVNVLSVLIFHHENLTKDRSRRIHAPLPESELWHGFQDPELNYQKFVQVEMQQDETTHLSLHARKKYEPVKVLPVSHHSRSPSLVNLFTDEDSLQVHDVPDEDQLDGIVADDYESSYSGDDVDKGSITDEEEWEELISVSRQPSPTLSVASDEVIAAASRDMKKLAERMFLRPTYVHPPSATDLKNRGNKQQNNSALNLSQNKQDEGEGPIIVNEVNRAEVLAAMTNGIGNGAGGTTGAMGLVGVSCNINDNQNKEPPAPKINVNGGGAECIAPIVNIGSADVGEDDPRSNGYSQAQQSPALNDNCVPVVSNSQKVFLLTQEILDDEESEVGDQGHQINGDGFRNGDNLDDTFVTCDDMDEILNGEIGTSEVIQSPRVNQQQTAGVIWGKGAGTSHKSNGIETNPPHINGHNGGGCQMKHGKNVVNNKISNLNATGVLNGDVAVVKDNDSNPSKQNNKNPEKSLKGGNSSQESPGGLHNLTPLLNELFQ